MKKQEKHILRNLAKANIKENKMRNVLLVTSIIAVTIMLLTVFGVGISYYHNFMTMNTRMKGTELQGYISGISGDKQDKLETLDEVIDTGKQYFVGTLAETGKDIISVSAYSRQEWKKNILPTLAEVQGKYPEEKNEIMLSQTIIEMLGLDENAINQKLNLTIQMENSLYEETFTISGIYKDFISADMRPTGGMSGNILAAGLTLEKAGMELPRANCMVSEILAKQFCTKNRTYVTFNIQNYYRGTTEELEENIAKTLQLSEKQNLNIIKTNSNLSGRLWGILLAAGAGAFVSICGYLCIYNIMNISLKKDIHFWGSLKAIGTNQKQLRYIVAYQTNYFICCSLPAGLVIGALLTIKFVPFILRTALGGGGYTQIMPMEMSFHPSLFILSFLFCYFTVKVSMRKAVAILSDITPIEALRYQSEKVNQKKKQFKCNGKIYRMAWCNVYGQHKKFLTVVMTLFLGLFLFLLSYTIFSAPDWNKYLDRESPDDISIIDITLLQTIKGVQEIEPAEFSLTDEVFHQLSSFPQIENIEKVSVQPVMVKNTDGTLDSYQNDADEIWGTVMEMSPERVKHFKLANNDKLTDEMMKDFVEGKTVFLNATDQGEYPYLKGKKIKTYNKSTGKEIIYEIGGILQAVDEEPQKSDDNPQDYGGITSKTYNELEKVRIFASDRGIKMLNDQPIIYQLKISVEENEENQIKDKIKEVIDNSSNIHIVCRDDLLPAMKPLATSYLVIGTIFSAILLLMGVMNYVNALCTDIFTREKELAVFSSIGMTKRQIILMLMCEGGFYALTTILLVSTIGLVAVFLIMKFAKEQFYFLEFVPPIHVIVFLLIMVGVICISIPWVTYSAICKRSVVDRLKRNEE